MQKEKSTVQQISEFVEDKRKIKRLLFRQFIHVNLGILVEPYANLLFVCCRYKIAIFLQFLLSLT